MQFSLKTLLLATVYCAVLAGILFAAPEFVSFGFLLILAIITPGILVIGIIHGRPYVRAFCIGGIIPATLLTWVAINDALVDYIRALVRLDWVVYEYALLRTWAIAGWVAIGFGGLAGMLMLWHLKAGEEKE